MLASYPGKFETYLLFFQFSFYNVVNYMYFIDCQVLLSKARLTRNQVFVFLFSTIGLNLLNSSFLDSFDIIDSEEADLHVVFLCFGDHDNFRYYFPLPVTFYYCRIYFFAAVAGFGHHCTLKRTMLITFLLPYCRLLPLLNLTIWSHAVPILFNSCLLSFSMYFVLCVFISSAIFLALRSKPLAIF